MPLTGKPEHDIPTEIKAGKPRKQAVAIALNEQREKGKDHSASREQAYEYAFKKTKGDKELSDKFADMYLRTARTSSGKTLDPKVLEGRIGWLKTHMAKDELLPVGDPERAEALHEHNEGITMSQDKRKAKDAEPHKFEKMPGNKPGTPCNRCLESKSHANHAVNKAKDEDLMPVGDLAVVAVKPVTPVPMPTENDGEQRYAHATDAYAGNDPHLADIKKTWNSKIYAKYSAIYNSEGKAAATKFLQQFTTRKLEDKVKAKDAIIEQRSGSEPADHLFRAHQYEIGGDRARALDSYRAAASGFRSAAARAKTADEADTAKRNETKARDGITACASAFDAQYQHPGHGRTKVCDSADAALRTALERTRAGEHVQIVDSKVVKPFVAKKVKARAMDTEELKPVGEDGAQAKDAVRRHKTPGGLTVELSDEMINGLRNKEDYVKTVLKNADDSYKRAKKSLQDFRSGDIKWLRSTLAGWYAHPPNSLEEQVLQKEAIKIGREHGYTAAGNSAAKDEELQPVGTE